MSARLRLHTATGVFAISVATFAPPALPTEVKVVDGNRFCVPRPNLIEPDVWLKQATQHLPEGGFAFRIDTQTLSGQRRVLAQKDIQGQDMPITGTFEAASSGRAIDRYPKDHYWRRMPQMPGAVVRVDEKLRRLSVFDAKRQFWVIWQIPGGAPLTVASLDDNVAVVASCHRTDFRGLPRRRVDETVSCARNTRVDGFRISYHFDPANLLAIDELDSAVSRTVLGWRCKQ